MSFSLDETCLRDSSQKPVSFYCLVPRMELALVGTALPILVSLTPNLRFDFDECPVGQKHDLVCELTNESDTLPIHFKFKRVAHFSTEPKKGVIAASKSQVCDTFLLRV